MILATGADARYFRSLAQLLLSVARCGLPYGVVIFDLGLSEGQRRRLQEPPFGRPAWKLRPFPPDLPAWFGLEAGNYAWKPALIARLLEEEERVFWLDSATILQGSLEPVERFLDAWGVWVPICGRRGVARWTHPKTLQYLKVPPHYLGRRQRCGGICAFDRRHPLARKLVARWVELCSIPECLAPPGAHPGNHRYDQALLTILLHQMEEEDGLALTPDEVDVASARPVSFLSARNKVHPCLPLALDPLLRLYFRLAHRFDVLLHRLLGPLLR